MIELDHNQIEGKSPMTDSTTKTVGVDLAKQVFAICETNHSGHVIRRLELRRDAFCQYLSQLPAASVVAMEACSGAHHWARLCQRNGLVPKIIAAQFVTPFRKSARNKNDRNDAEAIATAARQGNMRFVAVKDVDQQARLCWHRVREGYKVESLAIANRLRGLLAEFGLAIARSDSALQRALADDLLRIQLPDTLLPLLDDLYAHWQQVKQRITAIDRRVAAHAKADARSVRAQQLIGVGPLTADALVASIGNGHEFANGRQLAAWLGLTPTQHSSGGKARLGGISCRGDNYLRTLLIQGARRACSKPNWPIHKRLRPNRYGSRHWPAGCPLAKCWSPSPTNMRASYGRCCDVARTTTARPGYNTRWSSAHAKKPSPPEFQPVAP